MKKIIAVLGVVGIIVSCIGTFLSNRSDGIVGVALGAAQLDQRVGASSTQPSPPPCTPASFIAQDACVKAVLECPSGSVNNSNVCTIAAWNKACLAESSMVAGGSSPAPQTTGDAECATYSQGFCNWAQDKSGNIVCVPGAAGNPGHCGKKQQLKAC